MVFDHLWRNTTRGGTMGMPLEINSFVWKSKKENQECTSGDYYRSILIYSTSRTIWCVVCRSLNKKLETFCLQEVCYSRYSQGSLAILCYAASKYCIYHKWSSLSIVPKNVWIMWSTEKVELSVIFYLRLDWKFILTNSKRKYRQIFSVFV